MDSQINEKKSFWQRKNKRNAFITVASLLLVLVIAAGGCAIYLGAYSTADLKGTGLDVLSVFGSEDKVMDREKYDESKSNLPDGFAEIIIEGGCHAYFGMYGAQDGDGEPKITNEEQIYATADAIYGMISGNKQS